MKLVSLDELERRCQKPDHRLVGNLMARRVARPLALHVTRVVLPANVSAHTVTLVAWATGVAAAVAFGFGSVAGWLVAAVLLQLWYLLDHVDGQLARFHKTESLDGVQLDYLMHHTLSAAVPIGIGWGLSWGRLEPKWMLAGLAWAASVSLLALLHDTRYKAFIKRLKRLRGTLLVEGGGGGRPAPQPAAPRTPLRFTAWLARKFCEAHVTINMLAVLSVGMWISGDVGLLAGRVYLAGMALVSLPLAAATVARSLRRGQAESEFASWFKVPPESDLVFEEGYWYVRPSVGTHPAASNDDGTNRLPADQGRRSTSEVE